MYNLTPTNTHKHTCIRLEHELEKIIIVCVKEQQHAIARKNNFKLDAKM